MLSDFDSEEGQIIADSKPGSLNPNSSPFYHEESSRIDNVGGGELLGNGTFSQSYGLYRTDSQRSSFDIYNPNHTEVFSFSPHSAADIASINIRLCLLNCHNFPQDTLVHGMSINLEVCSTMRRTLEAVLATSACFAIFDFKNIEKR